MIILPRTYATVPEKVKASEATPVYVLEIN